MDTAAMEREISNVFVSQVPIKRFKGDHLYHLLDTESAQPIQHRKPNPECVNTSTKKSSKIYVSSKICKRKVRTVRQIRMEYEQYVFNYLPHDLEMQHKYLLDKICRGSSKEKQIIEKAQKLIKSYSAMRRSSWQMLMNINPNGVAHPMQYVLWKGSTIKLSGSKGGNKKILHNLDLSTKSKGMKLKDNKKNGLLRNSLEVTFKPGPLTKKESLDTSFQKYTLGKTELKPLPQAGLQITTNLGAPLPPYLLGFLQNSRERDGTLTKEWINFAISTLQNKNDENVVTFNIPYQNNKKRILIRDNNTHEIKYFESQKSHAINIVKSERIDFEIISVIHDLLMAVEVNEIQDTLFIHDDLNIDTVEEEKSTCLIKGKSEKNFELKKLDVTIIHVDGNLPIVNEIACSKQFCVLGCVCQSLQCKMQLKNHCGRFECMFDCKCDFKNYCINNNYSKGYISGLINLDKKINRNLAKEEQKFHQTVVFTEGKSIVISSKRRNPRMTKKYSEYLNSIFDKPQEQDKELLINLPRLQCSNIEAWCMVHELYRCFCRGKYLTNLSGSLFCTNEECKKSPLSEENPVIEDTTKFSSLASQEYVDEIIDVVSDVPSMVTSKINPNYEENAHLVQNHVIQQEHRQPEECISNIECARTNPYSGNRIRTVNEGTKDNVTHDDQNVRKIISLNATNQSPHDDKNAGKTISLNRTNESTHNVEIEEKSVSINTINESVFNAKNLRKNIPLKTRPEPAHNNEHLKKTVSPTTTNESTQNAENVRKPVYINTENQSPVRTKKIVFGLWLERHYKHLKERMAAGLPIILLKPTPRRISLFPWLELLKRYQLKSNYFLVNKTVPHRVFISVNPSHREFKNCMNLSDVTFDDLSNYPEFVRHFVMNTDLKDNFALLRGSSNYWEVLGIVAKNSNLSITPLQTPIDAEITSPESTVTESGMLGLDTMSESMQSSEYALVSEASEMALTSLSSAPKKVSATCGDLMEPIVKKPHRPVVIKKSSSRQEATNAQKNKERSSKSSSILKLVGDTSVKRKVSKTDLKTRSAHRPIKIHKSPLFRNRKQKYSDRQGKPELSHGKVVKVKTVGASKRKQTFCISDPKDSISEEISIGDLSIKNNKEEVHSKSRWFVMAIENDFLHLKFFKKKLFVKQTNITHAIELARASGQTVILPLSKMYTSGVQFGIYATPVMDKDCVLIGPYEINEDLGIETVKDPNCSLLNKKTRGVWLVTKKVDNSDVLENPLSYLSQSSDDSKEVTKGNLGVLETLRIGKQAQDLEESIVINKIAKNDFLSLSESTMGMAHTILKQKENLLNATHNELVQKINVREDANSTKTFSKKEKLFNNANIDDFQVKEGIAYISLNKTEKNLNTNEIDKMNDIEGNKITCSEDDFLEMEVLTEHSKSYTGEPKHEVNSHVSANAENAKSQKFSKGGRIKQSNYVNHGGVTLKTNVVKPAKVVKPICIKRNNSFYNLNSNNLLRPFSLLKPFDGNAATVVQPSNSAQIVRPPTLQCLPIITNVGSLAPLSSLNFKSILKASEDSANGENKNEKTPSSPAKIFTILKPDQINKKSLQCQYNEGIGEDEEHLIEGELTDSKSNSSSEVYVLSDDELSDVQPITTKPNLNTDVLIECINLRKLGCLWGRRNSEGKISFKLPGFKYSAYYTEDEASNKINQVLSIKRIVPKSLKLKWREVDPCTGDQTMLDWNHLERYVMVSKDGFNNASVKSDQINSTLNNELIDSEESDVGSVT